MKIIITLTIVLTCLLNDLSGQINKNWGRKVPLKNTNRLALIIGNADYEGNKSLCLDQKVCPPINDANDLAKDLEILGFEVILATNLDKWEMQKKISEFENLLITEKYKVALFFYSGHGAEAINSNNQKANYLFPISANPTAENDIEFHCLDANQILSKMTKPAVKTKIVLLDACRDNPFTKAWTKGAGNLGLGQLPTPDGFFIGYATSPGNTASNVSQNGRNGLYTEALLKHIKTPDITIDQLFNKVNKEVKIIVGNNRKIRSQTPFKLSSMDNDFFSSKKKQIEIPIWMGLSTAKTIVVTCPAPYQTGAVPWSIGMRMG